MSALWHAAANGDTGLVRELAKDKGSLCHLEENVTPAWIAGYRGHMDALFALRKAGAENDFCTLLAPNGVVESGTVIYITCKQCKCTWEEAAHLRTWWNKAPQSEEKSSSY